MRYLEVQPTYGRDYASKKAALAAWNEGKDFEIVTFGPDMGRKINNRDASTDVTANGDGLTVNIRYKRLTMVVPVKVIRGA